MKIKSKKTGLVHVVEDGVWEKIKKRGDATKYIIVSNAQTNVEKIPNEAKQADHKTLVKEGLEAFNAMELEKAQALYLQAQDIKKTDSVEKKLVEIDDLIKKST